MKFCPVVPEICRGQVHVPKKERRKRRKRIIIIRRNVAKTISLPNIVGRLNNSLNFWYDYQISLSPVVMSNILSNGIPGETTCSSSEGLYCPCIFLLDFIYHNTNSPMTVSSVTITTEGMMILSWLGLDCWSIICTEDSQ